MDFRNKYLKYKPEITFDIFQKVWDKLIESGYLPFGKNDVEKGFRDFKTLHCYLRTTESHPMEFNCYSVIPALFWVETTVQEILGYDPFVNGDDFVLPKKWYVEVTPENKSTLNDWKVKQEYFISLYSWEYKFISENGGGYLNEDLIKDSVKITFEQFKRYVLKQNVEKGKEVVPEYVECISWFGTSFTPSKIYKVVNGKVKDNYGHYEITCLSHECFKPSSKSAFDAQSNYEFLSTEDKYKEVLRKNARTLGGEVVEIDLADYDALLKNMFDFNVSEQTANNISETIDIAIQTAKVGMLEDALKSFTCEIQHYDHEFLAQMIGGKVSKVNKVQISTDNEIKINIIQKQSIKI